MDLDLDFVRSQFPALGTSPFALFDNAGGSVTAAPVIDRVGHYMRTHQVQLGASYGLSQAAEAAVRAGEAAAAMLLGCETREAVVGPSTTANLGTIARAMGPRLKPGDEVVVTNLDHEANIGCWRRMAAQHDLVLKEWRLRPGSATLDVRDLAGLLGPRTRLVTFTHCANVVGEILDIPAIVARIREVREDTTICVDGVAYAPHRQVDVAALGVDLYAVSLYKVYGPHQGVVFGKHALLESLEGQNHDFIPEDDVPYKLQPGNVTHELTAGLPGITDYLDRVAEKHNVAGGDARTRHREVFELFTAQEARLCDRLLTGLRDIPGVTIVGPHTADPSVRVPTVAFTVRGHSSASIPPLLDARGVGIRFGHFYARGAIEALGLPEQDGVVRVSMVHYNTLDEVDRLLDGLKSIPAA